jgi:PH/SEC7 domain-containing protein
VIQRAIAYLQTSAPSRIPSSVQPPVPPIPQSFAREADARRRLRSNDADVFGEVQSTTANHSTDGTTAKGIDKPLPVIRDSNMPLLENKLVHSSTEQSLSPTATQRRSMHSRQPASDAFDNDEKRPPLTTPQKALASFSEDVNGMFSGIGETHLANELGLPPDSLRVKNRTTSNQSNISANSGKFPSDLGKKSPHDRPSPVPSRTTSLPTTPNLAPPIANRAPSSPMPNMAVRSPTPLSRTSSNKSVKKAHLEPAPADFGPTQSINDTYKPRQREISNSTITGSTYAGASVRLVASPRPSSIFTSPAVSTNGAEWHKSPEVGTQGEDAVEVVITPGPGEDDEEKGRRLACELLDDDFSTIAYEKAAIFLGGP